MQHLKYVHGLPRRGLRVGFCHYSILQSRLTTPDRQLLRGLLGRLNIRTPQVYAKCIMHNRTPFVFSYENRLTVDGPALSHSKHWHPRAIVTQAHHDSANQPLEKNADAR
jgi:hypothetical protein